MENKTKDAKESYMHYAAKMVFMNWLKEASTGDFCSFCGLSWRSNGIHDEYPLVTTENWFVPWNERQWCCSDYPCTCGETREYPDYEWMIKNYKGEFKIADIVIKHKGNIAYIIEIVHKNEISNEKLEFYKEHYNGADVIQIPAHWIMGQVEIPREIPKKFFI